MRINIILWGFIMGNVPRINIYLDEEVKKKLKNLANSENRSVSKQIKHMMEYYLDNNK